MIRGMWRWRKSARFSRKVIPVRAQSHYIRHLLSPHLINHNETKHKPGNGQKPPIPVEPSWPIKNARVNLLKRAGLAVILDGISGNEDGHFGLKVTKKWRFIWRSEVNRHGGKWKPSFNSHPLWLHERGTEFHRFI
jgi:hypothetical protein